MPSDGTGHKTVRMLLVRHAERERQGGELAPLTAVGQLQAGSLGSWLVTSTVFRPSAILCSHSRHAQEHAAIVAGALATSAPVVLVTALTPHTPEPDFSVRSMRLEAGLVVNWERADNIMCIGHEPRLNQLAREMTGETTQALQFGEVLCIEADSWEGLEMGRGRLGLRVPPAGILKDETDLQPKIQSKMQTSALLAGFTSTVFGVVLTESDYWNFSTVGMSWRSVWQDWESATVVVGLVCLGFSTLLFVASIYMYDRLAMPPRYWAPTEGTSCRQDWWPSFRRDREVHGLLYAYMIWTWRFVFSVAVVMAMLGFIALVLHRGVWPVTVLHLVAILAAFSYYMAFKPKLGVD